MGKVSISREALKTIFKTAKGAIAKDSFRPQFTLIQIEVTAEEIISVSLDGFKMARVTQKHNDKTAVSFVGYIKPVAIPKDLAAVHIHTTHTAFGLSVSETILTLDCLTNRLEYSFIPPAKFIRSADDLIPKTADKLQVSFNAKLLSDLLGAFVGSSSKDTVTLRFVERRGGGIDRKVAAVFERNSDGVRIEAILLPVRLAVSEGGGNE